MRCQWCAGTGEECGCGRGFCDHCGGSGELTDPPYGAVLREDVLSDDAVTALAGHWCKLGRERNLENFVEYIAREALLQSDRPAPSCGTVLPEEVVQTFVDYWNDSRRDETLGEFIRRIAQYAVDKT